VGTSTEIYDYLKLLFARIGKTFSPVSGNEVRCHSVSDVVDFISSFSPGTRILIASPLRPRAGKTLLQEAELLLQQGFTRLEHGNELYRIEELISGKREWKCTEECNVVVDRISVSFDEDALNRLSDSVQTAFFEGHGDCLIKVYQDEEVFSRAFSNRFESDGMEFEIPTIHTFDFNNPMGACRTCEGYGKVIGIDEDLVIPNKSLSVFQDAIACWKGEKMKEWRDRLVFSAERSGFPIHRPYFELTNNEKQLLWTGDRYFNGLNDFFRHLEEQSYKIQYRVMLSRYRGKTICPDCRGSRLKKEAGYVKVAGHSIQDLVLMPVSNLKLFFEQMVISDHEIKIARRILLEISNRLTFLSDVGLGYLTLNRLSSTLSGGESQRIKIARELAESGGSRNLYIMDEPTTGLHMSDVERLLGVIEELLAAGHSVVTIEHNLAVVARSDYVIDLGPGGGDEGGRVIACGTPRSILQSKGSVTGRHLKRFLETYGRA
jgi:excinuclease ABC subunit A